MDDNKNQDTTILYVIIFGLIAGFFFLPAFHVWQQDHYDFEWEITNVVEFLPYDDAEIAVKISRNAQVICARLDTNAPRTNDADTSQTVAINYALISHLFNFSDGENAVNFEPQNIVEKSDKERAQIGLHQMYISHFSSPEASFFHEQWADKAK